MSLTVVDHKGYYQYRGIGAQWKAELIDQVEMDLNDNLESFPPHRK